MILALRFSMKATKSASRRVWCSYLYPSPLRISGTYRVRSADWSLHASRPGQAQCSQRIDVDLRVNPGGVVVLVPQQLSDLRQGRARPEKLGSETVSEDMGAAVCATFDSNAIESGLGDH